MRKRPLGVWILTIWLGLFCGIAPATFAALGLAHGVLTAGDAAYAAALSLAVAAASVAAWIGTPWGRHALVVAAVVYLLSLAWTNYELAGSGIAPSDKVPLFYGRAVRSVIEAGIVVWYFWISGRTREFYEP